MAGPTPTPLNAPGPFIVEKDMCIACLAPVAEAPDLMAYDDQHGTCFFKRQPQTPKEVEEAVSAVWVSCCSAVQYVGDDPSILRRLAELDRMTQERLSRKKWWQFWRWLR